MSAKLAGYGAGQDVRAVAGVRAVAFDVMDTLVHDPFREALEAATGLTADEVLARRDPTAYAAFETGQIDEDEYWERHRRSGIDVDPDRFHAVRRARTRLLPGMGALLDELDRSVLRIAATNYPVWIDELQATHLAGRFDLVVASCRIGTRKPERVFFDRMVELAGVAADAVLFVDDRERNVVGARRCGIRAHRFTGADRLREWLVAEGVPLAPPPQA